MPRSLAVITFVLALLPPGAACTRAQSSAHAPAAAAALSSAQQGALQTPKFTPVEGADLKSRMEDAARRAASSRAPYWTAYSFDVRPGVAVDVGGGEFHGSMHSIGDTHVFVGTSNGMTVETRDLGVFVLREPGRADAVTRMEIYNLRRPREYAGHPVYWAGRASNEESLGFLRSVIESKQQRPDLPERATVALAIHDDARVTGILKNLVGSSKSEKIRSTAVFWLGQGGGEVPYLAAIVRDEKEPVDLRRTAAHAIGAGRDAEALSTLQSLYASARHEDIKRGIIHAVSDNENKDAAYAFILRVAQTDPDPEARRTAAHQLKDVRGEAAVEDIIKLYSTERDEDVRRQLIHALGDIGGARADAKLSEIARSGDDPDLRRQAVHQIGERDTDAAFDELSKIYEAERTGDVKRQILHAFSEMKTERARAKLLAVARDRNEQEDARRQAIHWLGERGDDEAVEELKRIFEADGNEDVRRQILHALSEADSRRAEDYLFEVARRGDEDSRRMAIHMLGERAGERSFEMLSNTVNSSDEKTEVQVQAVRAISERPAEQAVPALIKVARTHPNAEVRKEAIRRLGQSGDPRAVEFFREILTK